MEAITKVIPARLSDGSFINVEVRDLSEDQSDFAEMEVSGRTEWAFSEATKTIESIAKEIGETLRRISPQKASVTFGVEVALKEGRLTALFVNGSSKASMEICLEWVREK